MAPKTTPWPTSWHDHEGSMKCPARGCTKRFQSGRAMGQRATHWSSNEDSLHSSLETNTDHKLLLLFNQQTKCPYCDFTINATKWDVDIRDLFEHESQVHGTINMTGIEAFVRLVRERRLRNLGMQAEPLVFERLLQEIQQTPCYLSILRFLHIPVDQAGNVYREGLASILAFNRPLGTPEYYAIRLDDFLMHLEPDLHHWRHIQYNW